MEIQVMEDILGRNDQIAAENQQLLGPCGPRFWAYYAQN